LTLLRALVALFSEEKRIKTIIFNFNFMSLLKEIFIYFIRRKKFWLIPVILILSLVAFLFLITEGTVVAPLIYTIF